MEEIKNVKGTHDIFGEESLCYDNVETMMKSIAELYAYKGLELRWRLVLAGDCSFRVVCEGGCTAEVSVNGVVLTPDANGVYSFVGTVGEQAVSIACSGAGTATVDSFACPRFGMLLLVK